MIDTHCHLDAVLFDDDRARVLARARAAGVTDLVVPGVEPDGWDRLLELCRQDPGLHPAVGIHPQALPGLDPADDDRHLADLEALLGRGGGAVAVGECGLDGPMEGAGAPMDRQRAVLRGHLDVARRRGLPVILHCLRAHDALREELERDGIPFGGVLHSYSGSAEQVVAYARLGLHFSFAGPVTWPAARRPLSAVKAVPLGRLLVETDAPDQTPHPHRGERNEPARLPLVLGAVAAALGRPLDAVERATTASARALFRLPAGAP
ncbi:MAG TPA: TatD family hydrolase [Anaeromyxobacteraceae bacterium]|nr:TatD family hydrolase [Anaeromyxobacteraceae bacterium]